jgi:hypothetical protein
MFEMTERARRPLPFFGSARLAWIIANGVTAFKNNFAEASLAFPAPKYLCHVAWPRFACVPTAAAKSWRQEKHQRWLKCRIYAEESQRRMRSVQNSRRQQPWQSSEDQR